MKKYEEPKKKLQELLTKTAMLAGSPDVTAAKTFSSETSDDSSEPATQGFTEKNAW